MKYYHIHYESTNYCGIWDDDYEEFDDSFSLEDVECIARDSAFDVMSEYVDYEDMDDESNYDCDVTVTEISKEEYEAMK